MANIESVAYIYRHDSVLYHLHISSRAFLSVTFPYKWENGHARADRKNKGMVTIEQWEVHKVNPRTYGYSEEVNVHEVYCNSFYRYNTRTLDFRISLVKDSALIIEINVIMTLSFFTNIIFVGIKISVRLYCMKYWRNK